MACRYTYNGATYEAHEFDDVLRAMPLAEAAKFMPSVRAIPSAPFVESTNAWVTLALKRIITLAVESGADRVAFVTGEQSADRYSLSSHVTKITYTTDTHVLRGYKGRTEVFGKAVKPDELAAFIGGEIAAKLLAQPDEDGYQVLAGIDLKVGGKGMIDFYDRIVPAAANKLLEKIGGGKVQPMRVGGTQMSNKVTRATIAGREEWRVWGADDNVVARLPTQEEAEAYIAKEGGGSAEQLGFDVTPAMREKAAGGLPLFAQRSNRARWTADRIDRLLRQYAYNVDPSRTKAYAGWVSPEQFLKATTPTQSKETLESQNRPLDEDKLRAEEQEIYIEGSMAQGGGPFATTGHEGRHRMMALRDAGVARVPVVFYVSTARDEPDAINKEITVRGQQFNTLDGTVGFKVNGLIPITRQNADRLREEFGQTGDDSVAFAQGNARQIQVDGKWRPIDRADGSLIVADHDTEKLQAFWQAFDGEVDEQGRPKVTDEQVRAIIGDAPRFAQEAPLGPNDPRRFAGRVRETLHELSNTPGKLHWWHKTVGTKFNLAKKSPLFGRVFDAVQSFLSDVSLYATEAANLAPDLLPKLERIKDITKTALSAADTKAIARPIFEGTLAWIRMDGNPVRVDTLEAQLAAMDPNELGDILVTHHHISPQTLRMWRGLPHDQFQQMVTTAFRNRMLRPGIVWTNTELENRFGLNEKQRGYYRQFRASVDKSIRDLFVSDVLRVLGKDIDAEARAQVLGLADDIGAVQEYLRSWVEARSLDDPKRGAIMEKNDVFNKIMEKADAAQKLIERGYAPLSRFGHYTVDVVGADGERLHFGLYESRLEAAKAAQQFAKMGDEFEGATITRGTLSQEEYKLFAGVSPETIELMGEMLGLDSTGDDESDAAFQAYLQLAKSNRSAMKRMIHRKGTAGFSEDVSRVLAGFVYSNARQTARNLHAGEVEDAITAIPKGQGELKDEAIKLRDYVNNPTEEAHQLRGLLFAQYLGGSIASALVNMTQPFTMTLPFLSQFGGIKAASGYMKDALRVAWSAGTGDAALDRALAKATEQGIVAPQEVHQLMAQAAGTGALKAGDGTTRGNAMAEANNNLAKLKLAWGKPFSTAELFNRRVTFVAAYKAAIANREDDPYAFAVDAVEQTQGLYNKGNRPSWARGTVGATVMTFRQFSIAYLEMIERMWNAGAPGSEERAAGRRAVFFAAGIMLLAGGGGGFPFMEDVGDLVDGLMQRLGYNWNTKQKRQEMLEAAFGRGLGHFLEKGVSGLPGVPIDVAGRLGLGNLIPATGVFTKKEDHGRDLLELLGPTGDLAQRAITSGDQLTQGRVIDAGVTLAPTAAQNLAKGLNMLATGEYRDTKGRKVMDVDGVDAFVKSVGFQPSAVARVQEGDRQIQSMVALTRMRESEIADAWAKGLRDSDPEATVNARNAIALWNTDNPETPIKIKFGDVLKRVKNLSVDRATRIEKSAPREVRQEVKRQLQDR